MESDTENNEISTVSPLTTETETESETRPTTATSLTADTNITPNSKIEKDKGKEKKPRKKKLKRAKIYKKLKAIMKKIDKFNKTREKFASERRKLIFYWDYATNKYLNVEDNLHEARRLYESHLLQKSDGQFHSTWKNKNKMRVKRTEVEMASRNDWNSWITKVLEEQTRSSYDSLAKFQDQAKHEIEIRENFLKTLIEDRLAATSNLTNIFNRTKDGLLENEENIQKQFLLTYNMKRDNLKKKLEESTENQEKRLAALYESNSQEIKDLLALYNEIISHNFIEIRHSTAKVNEARHKMLAVRVKRDSLSATFDDLRLRLQHLNEIKSHSKREFYGGKQIPKALKDALKVQEKLVYERDVEYINKEWVGVQKAQLQEEVERKNDLMLDNFFSVKRNTYKHIQIIGKKIKDRSLQAMNYNQLVDNMWGVQPIDMSQYESNEQNPGNQEDLQIKIDNYVPYTVEEAEECQMPSLEALETSVIMYMEYLAQTGLTLDDLHFFIRRRHPVVFVDKIHQKEYDAFETIQMEMMQLGFFDFSSSLNVKYWDGVHE